MASRTTQKNIYSVLDSDNESNVMDSVPTASSTKKVSYSSVDDTKKSTMVPFNGRNVVELRNEINDEYPTLGSEPVETKPPSKKPFKKDKIIVTRFIVGSSYIDERRKRRPTNLGVTSYPRSRAFEIMDNKEEMAKKLVATRACKNVTRASPEVDYGVCYREKCTFAHGLDELNDPMCGFDGTCRFRNGKPRSDYSIDSDTKCKFRHSDETRADWVSRTRCTIPDLPPTSEKTRKVTPVEVQTPKQPVKLQTPKQPVKLQIPSTLHKSMLYTGESLTPIVSLPNTFDYHSLLNRSQTYNSHSPIRRRSRSSSPGTLLSDSQVRVISVPTDELAKIAIRTAFDQGITNLRIVVE